MRLKTVLMAVALLVVVLIIAAVVVLKSIDFNQYKGLITEQAKAATGRELKITGNLDLRIGFTPAIVVEEVSFANASWGSRPDMVKLRRLDVEVALFPLIFRQIQVNRLILVQPDILLETDLKGTGNWALGAAAAPVPPKQPTGEKTVLPGVAVQRLRIEKGALTFRDGKTRRVSNLAIDRLDVEAKDLASPLTIDLSAAYNGKPFTLAGTVGALGDLQAPSKPYPVKLAFKIGEATTEVEGTIAKPMEATGLDLALTAKGPELAELATLADQKLPPVGPFVVKAKVTGSMQALSVAGIDASVGKAEQVLVKATGSVKDALNARGIDIRVAVESKDLKSAAKTFGREVPPIPPLNASTHLRDVQGGYAFEELKAGVGRSSLNGSGAVAMGGPRPKLRVQVASPLLDLSELLPQGAAVPAAGAGSPKSPQPAGDKRMFPADPLPLEGLKAADADVDLKVDHLVLPNKVPVEALVVRLGLAGGRLEVQPLSGRVGGGTFNGHLALDASTGKAAVLATKIDAKAVDLGQVMRQMGKPDLVTGAKTDVSVDLRGSGASVRDLMAGLTGDLLLVLGEGKINNKFVDFLGADVLTQVVEKLNPLGKSDPQTDLKCGVVKFTAKNGTASTDRGIAFETAKMTVVSSGTANLKTEGIDFSLQPNSRGAGIGAGELVKLMRVRGTLGEPKVGVDEVAAAKAAASIGAGLTKGGVSSLLGSLAKGETADPNPCTTALGKTAPAKAGAAPAAAAPTAKEPAKKESAVDQVIKGLFGK
jgi:AsmA family protein